MEQKFLSKFAPRRARDRRMRCTKVQQEQRHRQHVNIPNRKSIGSRSRAPLPSHSSPTMLPHVDGGTVHMVEKACTAVSLPFAES